MTSERPALTQAARTDRGPLVRIPLAGAFGLKSLALALTATALASCQSALAPKSALPVHEALTDSPIDLTQAHWAHLPNGAQIAGLYPAEAAKTKQAGFALVHCQVLRTGDLENCEAMIERPAGYGFGDATVQATRYFKLAAGAYGPNASVDVPFQWKLR